VNGLPHTSHQEPADGMAPHQRLEEVAFILAAGILRLHARAALPTPKRPDENGPNCLEVRSERVLSGPLEFTVPRHRERSEPCD